MTFEDIEFTVNTNLIDDIIEFYANKKKTRGRGIHVTDLLYCPKKVKMMKERPDLQKEILKKPQVFHGSVFEKGLFIVVRDWAKANNKKVRFWVKGSKTICLDKEYNLLGESDIIIFDDDNNVDTLIEVKNRMFSVEPTEYYILQARLYGWMFSPKNLLLWIFTGRNKKEYDLSSRIMTDDDVKVMLDNFLNNRRVPMWEWECNYCPFRDECDVWLK